MKQLNATSLSEPVSFAELRPYLRTILWSGLGRSVFYVVQIIFFAFLLAFVAQKQVPFLWQVGIALFAASIVAITIGGAWSTAKHRAKIVRMAKQNGFEASFDVVERKAEGVYFLHGRHKKIIEKIDGSGQGITVGVCDYKAATGLDQRVRRVGFARYTLKRNLPHMVLDNVKNNAWKVSNLPVSFENNQKMSLEGDFDKHFTLYVPEKYKRDALYIFTPDVMAAFIDSGYAIDAEIIDKHLYIYTETNPSLASETFLKAMFSVVQTLGNKLEAQSSNYQDERVAGMAVNVVAPAGKRLKLRYSIFAIAAICLSFFIHSLYVSAWVGTDSLAFVAIAVIALLPVILKAIVASNKHRNDNKLK